MPRRDPAIITRTRLTALSPAPALAVLLAVLLLIGVGLALPPSGGLGGGPGGGDAALYRQISARVAAGEDYYHAAAVEHRASDYPLKPFTAVRLPTLAGIG